MARALWDQQETLSAMAALSGQGVAVADPELVIRYVDAQAAGLLGQPASQLLGRRHEALSPATLAAEVSGAMEQWVRHADGAMAWLRVTRKRVQGAWLIAVEDLRPRLTQLHHERVLREGSADPQLLFADKRVVDANQAALQALEATAEQVIGLEASELSWPVQADGRPAPVCAIEVGELAASQGSHTFDWTHRTLTGRPLPVEVTLTAIQLEGRPMLLCTMRREHGGRATREQALRQARDAAMAVSAARARFLATMSHEIRTPMNGVLGMLELLLGTQLDDRQRGYVETALDSGAMLLGLLNDILDFSRIDAGRIELHRSEVDPASLIEDCLRTLGHRAQSKGLCVLARVAGLPQRVTLDAGRLQQVLVNLVGNAIKFTEAGSVTVEARFADGLLHLAVEDTGPGVEEAEAERLFEAFFQGDSSTTRSHGGAGLGLAICRNLVRAMGGDIRMRSGASGGSRFEFSVAVEAASAPSAPPLGLAGVRVSIVDPNAARASALALSLGDLGLEVVRSGEQVSFIDEEALPHRSLADTILVSPLASTRTPRSFSAQIMRPWRRSDLIRALRATLGQTLPPEARVVRAQPAPGLRVLVAEDNPVNQRVTLALLRRMQCEVRVVRNGSEAVEAWSHDDYDVVLMDCQMPTMDGYAATRAIRRREPAGHRTRIIALTANAAAEDRERCLQAGMDDYLAKPVRAADLAELLAKAG